MAEWWAVFLRLEPQDRFILRNLALLKGLKKPEPGEPSSTRRYVFPTLKSALCFRDVLILGDRRQPERSAPLVGRRLADRPVVIE